MRDERRKKLTEKYAIDSLLYIGFLIGLFFLLGFMWGCSPDDELYIEPQTPIMELDGRLPIDGNGFYHLDLSDSSWQTIHRVTGRVRYVTEPTKIGWESNLYWTHQNELVSTTNCCSYVGDEGEINTIIAPTQNHIGDTLRLTATINEWYITKSINIVLE